MSALRKGHDSAWDHKKWSAKISDKISDLPGCSLDMATHVISSTLNRLGDILSTAVPKCA